MTDYRHLRFHLSQVFILLVTCRSGIVTQQMLDTPKKQFLLIGALEAAAQILGFVGAAKLPGQSVRLPL